MDKRNLFADIIDIQIDSGNKNKNIDSVMWLWLDS